MFHTTALLVSKDAQLVSRINDIIHPLSRLKLQVCNDLASARQQFNPEQASIVLIHLPDKDDEREIAIFLKSMVAARKNCCSLILTNQYRNNQAVAMLRAGATDYFDVSQDLTKLAYLIDVLTMRARGVNSPAPASREAGRSEVRSAASSLVLDPEIVEIMGQVRRVMNQDTTLLLTGETGTGKTRLARLIHELSPRRDEPFMVIDCAGLSANLVESEMFGHIRGAFTSADSDREGKFSAAGRGTILLDDINVLPMSLQSKLLRVVDERVFAPVGSNHLRPMKARLIAASNACLETEVAEGRFRADLYYRLNVIGFFLPPLRDRRQAVPPLANKFFAEFAKCGNQELRGITSDGLERLSEYDWPGNIRELRNIIERCVLLSSGTQIQVDDLPTQIRNGRNKEHVAQTVASLNHGTMNGSSFETELSKDEREIMRISEALIKHGNNRLRAAAEMGISRVALYKKLHKYGLINGTVSKK